MSAIRQYSEGSEAARGAAGRSGGGLTVRWILLARQFGSGDAACVKIGLRNSSPAVRRIRVKPAGLLVSRRRAGVEFDQLAQFFRGEFVSGNLEWRVRLAVKARRGSVAAWRRAACRQFPIVVLP